MCRPNAEPSLCRTPLPYGPLCPDCLWPDTDLCPHTEFKGAHGWAGQLRVLTLTEQLPVLWTAGMRRTARKGKCPLNPECAVMQGFRGNRSLYLKCGVHGAFWGSSRWCIREGWWKAGAPASPPTMVMPFASKHQTWVGLNTGGRSPGGTKPPWACPQERQRWLRLTPRGSQGAPRGASRTQTSTKTSCHCYPRQKSTPWSTGQSKGRYSLSRV